MLKLHLSLTHHLSEQLEFTVKRNQLWKEKYILMCNCISSAPLLQPLKKEPPLLDQLCEAFVILTQKEVASGGGWRSGAHSQGWRRIWQVLKDKGTQASTFCKNRGWERKEKCFKMCCLLFICLAVFRLCTAKSGPRGSQIYKHYTKQQSWATEISEQILSIVCGYLAILCNCKDKSLYQ